MYIPVASGGSSDPGHFVPPTISPELSENDDSSETSYRLNVNHARNEISLLKPISLQSLSKTYKVPEYCSNRKLKYLDSGLSEQVSDIPLISCDQDAAVLNTVVQQLRQYEVRCAIFYSNVGTGCKLGEPNSDWFRKTVPNVFTTTSSDDPTKAFSRISSQNLVVSITRKSSVRTLEVLIAVLISVVFIFLATLACYRFLTRPRPLIPKRTLDAIPLVIVGPETHGKTHSTPKDPVDQGDLEPKYSGDQQAGLKDIVDSKGRHVPKSQERDQQVSFGSPQKCEQRVTTEEVRQCDGLRSVNPSDMHCEDQTAVETAENTSSNHIMREAHASPNFERTPGKTPKSLRSGQILARDAYPFPVIPTTPRSAPLETIEEAHAVGPSGARADDATVESPTRHHWGFIKTLSGCSATSSKSVGVYSNDGEEVCSFCLEQFATGDLLRRLRCNHHFHAKCIDPWLLKSSTSCPICRKDILDSCDENGNQVDSDAQPGIHSFMYVKQRLKRLSESFGHAAHHHGRNNQEPTASSHIVPFLRRSHSAPVRPEP